MLFNSLPFLLFFPVVVLIYWVLPCRWRNMFLLVASYYFYMNWEPVYAVLILLSSVTTWGAARLMVRYESRARVLLVTTLLLNIGILFVYKYMGFVTQAVHDLLGMLGIAMQVPQFELLLPVGISFYTFQAIGYMMDVYRRTIRPESSLMTYCLFVSFFPQLVAGPIERAKNLLPQFHERHRFDAGLLMTGLNMMLWGYFMKLCIAENVAPYVNSVFNNIGMHNGKSIWLATFFFTFQIFCDFGGYSLIAIGAARCMGFRLMQNFRQPYLARNVQDFWRRWHISLSSWLTDYVYIPLGGSRCRPLRHHRNLMATFLVSGLWHGANWTYVMWGLYHGVLQSCHVVRRRFGRIDLGMRRLSAIVAIAFTFVLSMLGWVLFRANSLSDAVTAYKKMASLPGDEMIYNGEGKPEIILPLLLIAVLMLREIRNELNVRVSLTGNRNVLVSATSITLLVAVIMLCARFEGGQFIYFQF